MKLGKRIGEIFNVVPREEREGIHLDDAMPAWEVEGPKTFQQMLIALDGWLPVGSTLYFEGGAPDHELHEFLKSFSVQAGVHVAMGSILPRPKIFHVPATSKALARLAGIMERHAEPELAIHFHVYHDGRILIEWYDAFLQAMRLDGGLPEEKIKDLAGRFGKEYRKEK